MDQKKMSMHNYVIGVGRTLSVAMLENKTILIKHSISEFPFLALRYVN